MLDEVVHKILQAMALGFRDVNTRFDAVEERLDAMDRRLANVGEHVAVVRQDVRVLKDEAQHTNARLVRIENSLALPPLQKKFG